MSDHLIGGRVHVYEYGEASDDLRAAFYVDERAYEDPDLARTVLEIADATMTRLGVIYSVEVTSGSDARVPFGVPTWEEFRQRHFVDGVPLPVRPVLDDVADPPSWDTMCRSIEDSHRRFRDDIIAVLTAAFPDGSVSIRADQGPLLRSPASIDRSEEWYGFEVSLRADTAGLPPVTALEHATAELRAHGWHGDAPDGATTEVTREGYRLWIQAKPGYLLVEGESPLYRAPSESGSSFVIEPRPAKS